MILQALVEHYEDLAAQGVLSRPGWSDGNISYALYISDAGELEQAVSLKEEQERGKKKVWVPRPMSLPAAVKRSSGVASNFLWDNSSYILGIDGKGKPRRSLECFAACKALHHRLLDGVDSPAARAVLAFFDRWDPARAGEHPALSDKLEDILAGANLVFRCRGGFPQDDPLIREAWQTHYDAAGGGPEMVCLVTGKKGPVERIHPNIKGSGPSWQPMGNTLVGFNAPAFCSYGREQSYNAPTSKYAAFAYTSALNHLLSDREYVGRIGDATVLFWASGGQKAYQSAWAACFFGAPSAYSVSDLQKMMLDLCQGKPVVFDETRLDPGTTFYILGLSPNAARLSVRFFLKNSFGGFVQNVQAHQRRLEIVRPSFDKFETIPPWKLLDETVNQKAKDKSPSPELAGEVLRAILSNTRYPVSLYNGVMLRILAERKINHTRAAIIKAYLLKNFPDHTTLKEEILLPVNYQEEGQAFLLGCLMAILEKIQQTAIEGINQTLVDKYLSSAVSTPQLVLDALLVKSRYHLRKIGGKYGLRSDLHSLLTVYHEKFSSAFPKNLTHEERGEFMVGYYIKNAELRGVKYESDKEETKNA